MKGKKLTYKERIAKLEVDKSARRKLFIDLCAHVSRGMSMESFSQVTTNTLKSYFKRYPDEFDGEEYEMSLQLGRDFWEGLGRRQASGDCLGNSRTWYYNMSNRYGWSDRQQVETEHKGSVNVNVMNYSSKKASDIAVD